MKDLCSCKYKQEKSEHEYVFLQQYMNKDADIDEYVDKIFMKDSTFSSWSTESKTIKQQLRLALQDVVAQARKEILLLHLTVVEKDKQYHSEQFEILQNKMFNDPGFSMKSDRASMILFGLIEERCRKISDRTKCIYEYKKQLLNIEHH